MVAYTPNRNYPYSEGTDPADVPGALQALAEAVNDDVQANVVPRTRERTQGYARAGQTQTITPNTETPLEFQIEYRDNANMLNLVSSPSLITITEPGFYMIWGLTGVFFDLTWTLCTLKIRQNTTAITVGEQRWQSAAYQYTLWSISTAAYCNAGDVLTFTFQHNSTSNLIMGTTREFYAMRMAT